MTRLTWDLDGQRFYEQGLDQAVLYLSDGRAVPWNGLTAVEEDAQEDSEPIYYDGVKIRDYQKHSNWSGTIRAITYPDEFMECEGVETFDDGFYGYDQVPKPFSLSYRTRLPNDLDADNDYDVKIHVVFNIRAVPEARNYETESDDPNPVEFVWKVSASPGDVLGVRPSPHIFADPRLTNDRMLWDFQKILYGSDMADASLPSFPEMYEWIDTWDDVTVTESGGIITFNIRDYPEPDSPGELYRWLDAEQTFVEIDNVGTSGYTGGPGFIADTNYDGDNNPDTYNVTLSS